MEAIKLGVSAVVVAAMYGVIGVVVAVVIETGAFVVSTCLEELVK